MLTMLLYALGTAACAFAAEHLGADRVPHRRQPGHRRRVGGGRGDGGRGGAREAAGRGGRAALHLGARWGCSSATFVNYQIAGDCSRASPEIVVALRLPLRPGPRGGGVRGAAVRAGAGALAGAAQASAHPRCASCSRRDPAADRQRLRHGGHRADHLVELQRLHPDRRRPGSPSAEAERAAWTPRRRWRWARAGRRIATNVFNLGGLLGTLLTIPVAKHLGRRRCSASTSPRRRRDHGAPSAWTCRRRRGCTCTS